ncbi:MAG TPA: TonB family protein [Terriglobales bacterium]|nr:TonB family protein [Terriglobales bacterium]
MNAAVAQERWQGQIIDGKFSLLEWLGGSANAAVYRTELPGATPQPAAIKLIRVGNANAAEQIARWKESAALSHSGLLRIFEAGHCQITGAYWLYVVTELAEENLDQVLPVRPLSIAEVSELLPPVLDALRYLHAKGLVHGRIKPSNILAVNNQLKLSVDSLQPGNQKLGDHTLNAYDSPEAESGVLSDASDVWSLGMLLVTAFNQRPITWSRSGRQDLSVPKSVPAPYAQIAAECLRLNAEERCSLDRINKVLRQELSAPKLVAVPKPVTKTVATRKADSRNLHLKLIVPVVVVLVALALVIGFASRRSTRGAAVAVPGVSSADQQTPNAASETAEPSRTGNSRIAANGVVDRVIPQVPLSARETVTGKVRVKVRVSVSPDGRVASAAFVSPGPSKYFARLALESAQKWKFTPLDQSGSSASREWLLEYKFGRSGTEVTPVEVH